MGIDKYTFRQSASEDISTALALRARLFAEMGIADTALLDDAGERLFEIYSSAYSAGEIVHYFAQQEDGHIAAVSGAIIKRDFPYLTFKPGYYGWIIDVFTEPEHRGQGLAAKLLGLTHKWLIGKGAGEAKLISAGADARRLYEKLGYRHTWEMSCNLSDKPTYNEFVDIHSGANR